MKNKRLLEGYIHLRSNEKELPFPTVRQNITIAYLLASKGDKSELSLGVSVCSKKDQFCKKTGRDIAHGRMLKRPYGAEKFSSIDTSVFKSEKGRQELHKWILNTYITDVPVDRIKRHIYMILNQLY